MSDPVHRSRGKKSTDQDKAQQTQPTSSAPAKIPPDPRSLVERLLDTPHAAQVIRRLQPEVLHRVILTSGLEDAGELVALASPAQLQRVFDFDLWHAPRPGFDETLDADRFATWLEVLMDQGPEVAAEKLLGMDREFVTAAFAQHVRVFDGAAMSAYTTLDGELITPKRPGREEFSAEIGGFLIVARKSRAWDSLVPLLQHLDAEHPDGFRRLMRACRDVSHAGFERDGLYDLAGIEEQQLFDVASDRARRMEQQGYATPAQARAFLQSARQLDLAGTAPPARSPIARAYFHEIEEAAMESALTTVDDVEKAPASEDAVADEAELSASTAAVADLLADAGIGAPARALLTAPEAHTRTGLSRIQAFLRSVDERDADASSMRLAELAFLTNAIAAGSAIQDRPFTVREAGDAAVAICNLGLENWPAQWQAAEDLIAAYQVGWAVLHRDVTMYTAQRLIDVVSDISIRDRDIQFQLHQLRAHLVRQCQGVEPWRADGVLEVLAILDLPAWMALTALITDCPVIHAALDASLGSSVRAIDPTAFAFISENAQIDRVRQFVESLPDLLTR